MIQFVAGSLRATVLSMSNLGVTEEQAARAAVRSAGLILHGLVKQNISLGDHSLDDLAGHDHPYARRHGSIRIHQKGSTSIVNPAFRVHTQQGTMLSALRNGATNNGLGWRIEIDDSTAPHAKFVVQGTKVMLPRDVVQGTGASPVVQRRLMLDIIRTLGKRLRTKAAIRLGR